MTEHIQQILQSLPEKPGVYQHIDKNGTIIYVGKAKNLKRRVSSYFQKEHESLKTRMLVSNIADIRYIVVETDQDAFLLENNLIKKYQPHYNILLKDGKSYPSICITKEEYPRVFKTRKIDKHTGEYFGPFSYGNTVDLVLELIHQLYPLRTCKIALTEKGIEDNKYKVCLKYHLHTCCGVCQNYCSKQEYRQYIEDVKKIIRGNAQEISNLLLEQMHELGAQMRFEEAQKIKVKYDLIEKFKSKTIITNTSMPDMDAFGYYENKDEAYVSILRTHNGSIIQGKVVEYKKVLEETKEYILGRAITDLQSQFEGGSRRVLVPFMPDFIEENREVTIPVTGDRRKLLQLAMQNAEQYMSDREKQRDKLNPNQRAVRVLTALQDKLHLEKLPVSIESFDNSNIQGTDAVAACVVFKMAKPSKQDYKRYMVKTVVGADDYASMREIVYRRYKRIADENGEFPDLIIADGGIGQMHAIREAVEDQLGLRIPIAGLVKDSHHKTASLLFGFPPQEIQLKPTEELFHLLTHIQDEVHRFAITYHRQKRSKRQTASELDEIKNIGEKTKQTLLSTFKSVSRIKQASLQDLEKSIGKSRAAIVYANFHGEISA